MGGTDAEGRIQKPENQETEWRASRFMAFWFLNSLALDLFLVP